MKSLFLLLNFLLKTNNVCKNDILSKRSEDDERSNILLRITPYIIIVMIFILLVMFLWVMINHGGSITGTEANAWQRMEGII